MIKHEETNNEEFPTGNFLDHIIWLRQFFIKARANSSGERFKKICKTQDDLDEILEWYFNG